MAIEIKSWEDGRVLYVAENAQDVRAAVREAVSKNANLRYANLRYANLRYADLRYANLRYADLTYADLTYADLTYANLTYADLRYANLRYADLRYANLRYADLTYADGINPLHVNDLLMLHDQVGKVRAYKLVTADGWGPFNGGIQYAKGGTYEVADADDNPDVECGAGINLATLPWCVNAWREGHRILIAEFSPKDIAAIPLSDGKFRVRKCKIVGEKDLVELGLIERIEVST